MTAFNSSGLTNSACLGDSGSPLTYQVAQTDFLTKLLQYWMLLSFTSSKNQPWRIIENHYPRFLQKFLNFWEWWAGVRALARTPTLSSATSLWVHQHIFPINRSLAEFVLRIFSRFFPRPFWYHRISLRFWDIAIRSWPGF